MVSALSQLKMRADIIVAPSQFSIQKDLPWYIPSIRRLVCLECLLIHTQEKDDTMPPFCVYRRERKSKGYRRRGSCSCVYIRIPPPKKKKIGKERNVCVFVCDVCNQVKRDDV